MADDPVLDRVLLVNEPNFRVVRIDFGDGSSQHVLERKDGIDGMGIQRWTKFELGSSRTLQELWSYFVTVIDKEE